MVAVSHVFGHFLNVNFTYRLGLTVVPLLLNLFANRCRVQPHFNSIQFLDWVTQDRTARSKVELDTAGIRSLIQKNQGDLKGLISENGSIDLTRAFDELLTLS